MATATRAHRVDEAEASTTRVGSDIPVAIVSGAAAVGAAFLYWAVHYNLTDDAYITLAYAKTLAFHGTWGMVPHHSANSATSPLNVLLLAAGTLVTRRPLLALGLLFVGSATVITFCLARTARALDVPVIVAPLGAALLLLNPIFLSSTGLESILYAAILAALLMCAVEERTVAFGIVAGLGLLTRLDTVLFIVPLLLWTPALRRQCLRTSGIAVAVALPWFAMRWIVAGSAIPDTFVIKTLQKAFGDVSFGNGPWRYMKGAGDIARWSFAPVLFGGIALVLYFGATLVAGDPNDTRLMPVAALGIGGVAYYAAYTALEVPAYHWYYNPVIAAATVVLVMMVGAGTRMLLPALRRWRVAPAALLLFVVPALILFREARIEQKHGLPWRHVPVFFGNWAEPEYYRIAARGVRAVVGEKPVGAPPEIGTLAFYCECEIMDMFSDSRAAIPFIQQRIDGAGPTMRFLLKLNYHNLNLHTPPVQVDAVLLFEPGFAPDAPLLWNTWSLPHGPGHLVLVPVFH